MKHWLNTHYKSLIIAAFLIPIITVAIVSISHVTKWYGISNPISWAIYLSIGIEIAALSALAAISADMGKKVYFPFAIVTLVQFIGNIFFAYSYIDITSQAFKDWVDLVSPLVSFMGVEATDLVGHKRFLSFFAGGMLPVISLSFLHMLVKFTEEDRKKEIETEEEVKRQVKDDEVNKKEQEKDKIEASDLVSEVSRLRLSEEDLKKLEEVLLKPPKPNDALKGAAQYYKEKVQEKPWSNLSDETWERMKKIEKDREEKYGPMNPEDEPTALANSGIVEKEGMLDQPLYKEEDVVNDTPVSVEETELILRKPLSIKDVIDKLKDREELFPESNQRAKEMIQNSNIEEITQKWEPTISDNFTIGPEGAYEYEEEEFSTIEPSEEEEERNFSTIEPNDENIFQDNQDDFIESEIVDEISQNVKQDEPEISEEDIVKNLTQIQNETFSQEPTSLEEEKKN